MDLEDNIEQLKTEVQRLGIENGLENEIRGAIMSGVSKFKLFDSKQYGDGYRDYVNTELQINRDEEGIFQLLRYRMSQVKEIDIDQNLADRFKIRQLEERLDKIDWRRKNIESIAHPTGKVEKENAEVEIANEVAGELGFIRHSGPQGAALAEQLMAKHWINTPNINLFGNGDEIRQKYEKYVGYPMETGPVFTNDEANRIFDGRAIFLNPDGDLNSPDAASKGFWYQMDEDDRLHRIPIQAFNVDEEILKLPLKEILGVIPIDEIVKVLKRGGDFELTYEENGFKEKADLIANPLDDEINLDFGLLAFDSMIEMMELEDKFDDKSLNSSNMNKKDILSLRNNILDHGFSANLLPEVYDKIAKGEENFAVTTQGAMNFRRYSTDLHFIADKDGKIGFDKYVLTVLPVENSKTPAFTEQPFTQTFKVGETWQKGEIDLKVQEAFSVMRGDAVIKKLFEPKGDETKFSIMMDPHNRLPDGKFVVDVNHILKDDDLADQLKKFAIPNIEHKIVQDRIIQLLDMGHIVPVRILSEGFYKHSYISRGSDDNNLKIFDDDGVLIPPGKLKSYQNKDAGHEDNEPDKKRKRGK